MNGTAEAMPYSKPMMLHRYPGGFLNPFIQSILLGIVEGLTEFLAGQLDGAPAHYRSIDEDSEETSSGGDCRP